MNCGVFQENLRDFCSDALEDEQLHRSMLNHAKHCPGCATRLDEERSLSAALAGLAQSMSDETAPPHIEARLVDAFRETDRVEQTGRKAGASILGLRLDLGSLSTAAAFLILFGITLLAFRQGFNGSGTVRPDDLELAGPEQSQPGEYAYETDFIDLGNYQDPDYWSGSQLLRVNLPRTSLLLFGLPMNADHADKMIPADVLVGEDGVPRAIRFVQTVEYNRTN